MPLFVEGNLRLLAGFS